MKFRLIPVVCLVALSACGGGGGGGGGSEFVGAAEVQISVSPNEIDTHDRTRVTIHVRHVIDTGILLKVRYSEKLSYAVDTAKLRLESEDEGKDISPTVEQTNDDTTYLVYFLPRSMFGDSGSSSGEEDDSEPATITFELVGDQKLRDGKIEVDADVNDPAISDAVEFDINDPAFDSESDASIEVRESRA